MIKVNWTTQFAILYWFVAYKSEMELKGANGVCVTEQWGFVKNVSLNKFRKKPIQRVFFDFFGHFIHSNAMKSSILTKLGDFSLMYRNFWKFLAPAAPKMYHLSQFFPKFFQKFPFFGAFGAENVSLNVKLPLPPFGRCPLQFHPW